MDVSLFITVNLISFSAVALLLLFRSRPIGYEAWATAAGIVVVGGAAALYVATDVSGWITAGLFLVLLVVPWALSRLVAQALIDGQFARAEILGKIVKIFHPGGASVFNIGLERALQATSSADLLSALSRLNPNATPEQRALLDAYQAAERDDWVEVLACARRPEANGFNMAPLQIRALGELGQIDDMVQTYERVKTRLYGPNTMLCQLFLFAFSGSETNTAKLLSGRLSTLPADSKPYWLALARLRSDPTDPTARAVLHEVSATAAREKSRLAVARHLAAAAPAPSPASQAFIAAAGTRLDRIDAQPRLPFRRLIATIALIASNLAMFALTEWRGGAGNWDVLADTGALIPQAVLVGGEWWRILTAAFLHYGPVHLAANMLTLILFGQVVESQYGPARMTGLYLFCALASMLASLVIMRFGWVNHEMLVGASGAVLGLFGAVVADATLTWLRTRDALDLSRLRTFAGFVALQTIIDFSLPNVSFLAHASGFIAGLAAGYVLARSNAPRPPTAPRLSIRG